MGGQTQRDHETRRDSDPGDTERSTDGGTDDETPDGDDEGTGWLQQTWYRSRIGVAVVAGDVLLTAVLIVLTALTHEELFASLEQVSAGIVPPSIHVFSLLGALGFVFTALIEDFDSTVGDVFEYNFRLPAALPLGVGIFLFSDIILGQGVDGVPLVVGSVFLAGLYVNLAYKRLGALARRLLPARSDGGSPK